MERLGRVLERLGLMLERPVGILLRLGACGAGMERVFKRLGHVRTEIMLSSWRNPGAAVVGSPLAGGQGKPNYQDEGNLTKETLHRKTTYRE